MKQSAKNGITNIVVLPNPDEDGHQVSYEFGPSRRVHRFAKALLHTEEPPHGAGSFHNPEQHQVLMDRIEAHIRDTQS